MQSGAQQDKFVIHTGEELLNALQTQEFGRPLALGAAIEDAIQKKDLIQLKEFLDAKQSVYAKSWIPTPWQVLRWGLRQLGVLGGDAVDDKLVTASFVVIANVEVRLTITYCSTHLSDIWRRLRRRQCWVRPARLQPPTPHASSQGICSPRPSLRS